MDTESIIDFIIDLEKSGYLDLKIDKDKLNELGDIYFTGREKYETY